MNLPQAAREAGEAADIALGSAQIAKQSADQATRERQRVQELAPPDPQKQMIAEFAAREGAALLRVGPRRALWRDLVALDEKIGEIEVSREELQRSLGSLRAALSNESDRLGVELADWMGNGSSGGRPESRAAELEKQIADHEAEYTAHGIVYDRLLRGRAEHIAKHRKRMVADVQKAKEKVASEYAQVIDQAETARRELLELRQTEVWAKIFPDATLGSEPNTQALCGAKRRLQEPHLPGLQSGLVAGSVFALLREDINFCSSVSTAEQAAAERGVSVDALTGRDAKWLGNGKPDLVGPRFESAWGGSAEEKREAERVAAYTEATRRRVWGE